MSKALHSVFFHIESMSQDDIEGYGFYSIPDESIEHLRADFFSCLQENSLILWFFNELNLKE
ncbi:hypothetical protein LCGC14_1053450 [marine sediment metagenome]|uniref:Uncharacterized protein n=1 Tax=marine sediment metagenome TaxID=412755 RepID=A0A0F9N9X4_9ZZZZ|nr:hypothetical protein [Pricia sp.]